MEAWLMLTFSAAAGSPVSPAAKVAAMWDFDGVPAVTVAGKFEKKEVNTCLCWSVLAFHSAFSGLTLQLVNPELFVSFAAAGKCRSHCVILRGVCC